MRLHSVELTGYKTFASKTTFEFAGTITAIVGPNGSGKSNIADSLRWVLGEQSYSLLRGRKTEDMIFSGSEHRARAGMASATVLFDNSDGWLPIDFSEVALTRRAYRDGQNEYLINGQRMRLRDVSELLARSGLAERTYTIIGQGLVDRALSIKPEERRKLFEEAAGIGLYRARREEALRRLETTRRNLDRVADILAELKPRLRSLERQAKRAQEYEEVQRDLHVLLREWYGYHWHRAQRELTATREESRTQETTLEKARETQRALAAQMDTLRDQVQGLRARLNSWHRELAGLHQGRETLSRGLAVSAERERALAAQQAALSSEITRLEEETRLHEERLAESRQETAALQAEAAEARGQVQAARQTLQTRQAERQAAERAVQATRDQLAALTTRRARLAARRAELEARAERQKTALAAAEKALAESNQALTAAETRLGTAQNALQQAEHRRREAQAALDTHHARRAEIETARIHSQETRAALQTDIARAQAQHEVLEQAEKALAGYAAGARRLLQAAQKGALPGARGALSSALDVPAELEPAIAACLGEMLDAVLLEPGTDLAPALDLLAKAAARAGLLPLDRLAPPPTLPAPQDPACLGVAANLVRAAPELRPVVDLLLGRVWVVGDREAAARLVRGQPAGVRVVTLLGEVFHAEGPVFAGGAAGGGEAKSTLSRPRQRRELEETLQTARGRLEGVEAELRGLDAHLAEAQRAQAGLEAILRETRAAEETARTAHRAAQATADQARRQREWQAGQRAALETEIAQAEAEARQAAAEEARLEAGLTETQTALRSQSSRLAELPLEEHQAQVAHWETRAAVAERASSDAASREAERQQAFGRASQRLTQQKNQTATLAGSRASLEAEKHRLCSEETGLTAQIEALQGLIQPAEASLQAAEREQEALQASEAAARQGLTVAERHHAQAQIALARRQEALDHLRTRVEDDFGLVAFEYVAEVEGPTPLPLGELVEKLPLVSQVAPELGETVKQMRAQLRRMGAINPEAQKEYQEVETRHDFLVAQVADLEKAEAGIKEVIAELDVLMEREFRKTFEAVAREFREIFTRLFGGGTARLALTEPDELADSGVDIEARLPGRRAQGLSLLSGGERSLTAVALVFSLLKVSPTPFCVLDEVDAMLDEANVGRFTELLRELSQNTQFIIITHNRNTVQVADVIYGVTMGRDSVSQVLSLRLDEVADASKE